MVVTANWKGGWRFCLHQRTCSAWMSTPWIWLPSARSASHRISLPLPQPKSRIRWPRAIGWPDASKILAMAEKCISPHARNWSASWWPRSRCAGGTGRSTAARKEFGRGSLTTTNDRSRSR